MKNKFIMAANIIAIIVSFGLISGCAQITNNTTSTPPTDPDEHVTTVEASGNISQHVSLALNSAGYPNIAYSDNTAFKYAKWTGTTWEVETIDSGINNALFPSLRIDSNGDPKVAYLGASGKIMYATKTGASAWTTQEVFSSYNNSMVSLALDANGDPRLAISHGVDSVNLGGGGPIAGDLIYAKWTGYPSWEFSTISHNRVAGEWPSIALSSAGIPYISYYDYSSGSSVLMMASLEGTTWDTQEVDTTCYATSMCLDKEKIPHISYGDVKYAKWNGSSWDKQTIRSSSAGWPSMALDTNNYPRICFIDLSSSYSMIYTGWDGAAWQEITVEANVMSGTGPRTVGGSIAVNSAGDPRIAYCDSNNGWLMYYWK
jgi:hypothetical protein